MTTQQTGTVARVIVDRGFGFIRRDDGQGDVFFHVRDVVPELAFDETLTERRVEFGVATAADGRTRAVAVRPAS